jgi:uncharacterized membrane protein YgaE (UPF0421/DUF939 family)
VFAAVAAIVCLAPGLPNRGRQAINMMLGLVTGILVGEILLLIPVFDPGVRLAIIAFTAMITALSFGLAPVIAIQGGVSAILVLVFGPMTAGTTRLVDALVGTGVALIFSQVLLTPDPVRVIRKAAAQMLRKLAAALAEASEALAERDPAAADAVLGDLFTSRESLNELVASLNTARNISRWSVRGRLAASHVAEIARGYDRRAVRLFASILLFAETLAGALRKGREPPDWLPDRMRRLAQACRAMANGSGPPTFCTRHRREEPATFEWQKWIEHLRAAEVTLVAMGRASALSKAPPDSSA